MKDKMYLHMYITYVNTLFGQPSRTSAQPGAGPCVGAGRLLTRRQLPSCGHLKQYLGTSNTASPHTFSQTPLSLFKHQHHELSTRSRCGQR